MSDAKKSGVIAPSIHLNGTSKNELLNQLSTARAALNEAMKKLGAAAPNARGYYHTRNFGAAMDQHTARAMMLRDVYDSLLAEMEAIDTQKGGR